MTDNSKISMALNNKGLLSFSNDMFTKGGVRKLLHVTFTLELGQPQPQLGRALLMTEEKENKKPEDLTSAN